jgi:hypothetical protein
LPPNPNPGPNNPNPNPPSGGNPPFNPPTNYVDSQPTYGTGNQDPDAPEIIADIDAGAAIFVTISPTTPTDLSITGSGDTILIVSNPAPVEPAHNAEPLPPHVTQQLGQYLNQLLSPTVPTNGVPGIQFNYSSSGNSSLW